MQKNLNTKSDRIDEFKQNIGTWHKPIDKQTHIASHSSDQDCCDVSLL